MILMLNDGATYLNLIAKCAENSSQVYVISIAYSIYSYVEWRRYTGTTTSDPCKILVPDNVVS